MKEFIGRGDCKNIKVGTTNLASHENVHNK
jgi:hypothetical protein